MYSTTLRAIVKSVSHASSIKGEKDLLESFEQESLGVNAMPKCGACAYWQCIVQSQPMCLKMEKAYQEFKKNLVY